MKHLCSLICLLLVTLAARAQNTPFFFQSQIQQPYTELAPPVQALSNGVLWDNTSSFPVALGFAFPFHNQSITSINVLARGIQMVGVGSMYMFVYNTPFGGNLIQDRGIASQTAAQSPISYQVTGAPGSRIGKVEWKNAGPTQSSPTPPNPAEFVNCQLWLYESGRIEVHFGAKNTTATTFQNNRIFLKTFLNPFYAVAPTGTADNPSYQVDNCPTNTICYGGSITGTPSLGVVYQFEPNPGFVLATAAAKKVLALEAYPNPAASQVSVVLPALTGASFSVRFVDYLGRIAQETALTTTQAQSKQPVVVATGTLDSGVYALQVCAGQQVVASRRIAVQH